MTQLKSADLSELDFDTIKTNLKAFLKNQDEFTDYDFDGSALSILLDVLAYNTHYNAYIANMVANEMFLDSAVKRSSAISAAKQIGFTPASARSARATINVTVNSPEGNPDTLTIDAKTPFTATVNDNTFSFFNLEATTITPVAGVYTVNNLDVVEGEVVNLQFASATPGPDEKFEIPDPNIDTSTLKVTIQSAASNTSATAFNLTVDTTNVTSTSRVFFLEMNPTERYEIFFGDGNLGKLLENGNIINVEYLKSTGIPANTSNNATVAFTTSSIGGSTDIDITTVQNPSSARAADQLTDIKFKAPRVNAARNRAVTAADYKALIEANFTDAESVVVFGGEDNSPPKFGKVIISLKPFDGFTISTDTKNAIINDILREKKVMAIQPEFIDPEFFFVNLTVNIQYDSSTTTLSADTIKDAVTTVINNYFSSDLQKFNQDFNKSKLIKNILDNNDSIVSVIMLISLQKRNTITLNTLNTFAGDDKIKFENPVQPGTIKSSRFFQLVQNTTTLVNMTDVPDTNPADDSGTGTIAIVNSSSGVLLEQNLGNVNYATGDVSIGGFTPTALPNNITDFRMTSAVQESGQNIRALRNQILVRDKTILNVAAGRDAGLTVNMTAIVQ